VSHAGPGHGLVKIPGTRTRTVRSFRVAMPWFRSASHERADRWACRAGLLLEVLLVAWLAGRVAAGVAAVDIVRLAFAVGLTAFSSWVSVLVHGRAVLFLEPRRP
jgi:hypothetical protein